MYSLNKKPVVLTSASEYLRIAKTSLQRRLWSGILGFGDNCWIWQRRKNSGGYGIIRCNGFSHFTHRLAYYFAYGEFDETKYILHSCDVRACCNPSHLRVGTHRDNTADMVARNRCRAGTPRYRVDGIDG